MTGPRVGALDGLRGVAVILVFITHAVALPLNPASKLDAAVRVVAHAGWTGVDLFFVLSGFLITGILLDSKGRPHWWRNFFMRRMLRVFPLYFGSLALVLWVAPLVFQWTDPAFALLRANQAWYWTYTVNILGALTHGRGTPPFAGHFWSLAIEEQFYLLWPLIVWLVPARRLPGAALAVMVGGLAFRSWLVWQNPAWNANAAFLATPGRLDGLMVGATLAVYFRRPGGLRQVEAIARPLLIVTLPLLFWLGIARRGFEHANQDPLMAIVSYPMIALAWGAALVLALGAVPSGPVSRLLGAPSLGRWGKYSYGIYVIHLPLVGVVLRHVPFFGAEAPLVGGCRTPVILLLAVGTAVASYALAWISFHLYERRFLALKRYFQGGAEPCAEPQSRRATQTT